MFFNSDLGNCRNKDIEFDGGIDELYKTKISSLLLFEKINFFQLSEIIKESNREKNNKNQNSQLFSMFKLV